MTILETFHVGTLTVRIYTDPDPFNPRKEWNPMGTMVCWHPRYQLGDKHGYRDPSEFMASEEYKHAAVILPLGLYDHSGITMYVGDGPAVCDAAGWDSGQVGWIYMTREQVKAEYVVQRLTKKVLARARESLAMEVRIYDQYLTGDVYGYEIRDARGRDVDSCWGMYGWEYCREEAQRAAEQCIAYKDFWDWLRTRGK